MLDYLHCQKKPTGKWIFGVGGMLKTLLRAEEHAVVRIAVGGRRDLTVLFENFGKVIAVAEAGLLGNFFHGKRGAVQE